RKLHRVVSSGGSFGASPLELHLGIGKATRIKRLEILWPRTGKIQVLESLDASRRWVIEEKDH
ncbi:MAG: ASPIC/UnbV domain-containing protein, partial [Bdellovibrionota bacterium]